MEGKKEIEREKESKWEWKLKQKAWKDNRYENVAKWTTVSHSFGLRSPSN